QRSTNLIYAGAQDNGTDQVTGVNTANRVMGADGEECLVDFSNDNVVFVSYQGGNFSKSTDGGVTFNPVSQGGCDWTSPLIMDPTNNNVMYMGGSDVFKSTDNGNTWSNMSNGAFDGNCLYSLEVSNGNTSYIYAATFGNIYRSTNGGNTWSTITGTLPVGNAAISGITISDANPDAAWVTFSGFSAGNKVFYTNDGGQTWSNVSGTLPNIPINCIEYQNSSNDLLYIGTDLGVFYTDATQNNWIAYNTGLPNVIIDELEIHYATSKLRAATYGRGLWESDLQQSSLQQLDASTVSMLYPPLTTCDTSIAPVVRIRNAGIDTITAVQLHYRMDAQAWSIYSWTGSLASNAIYDITLPTYTLPAGAHTLKAYTANPNASTDLNNFNDTIVRTFTIMTNPSGSAPPLTQGFVSNTFPPVNWGLENSSSLLSRSTAAGGFGNSSESMMADFYSVPSGSDMLTTPYIDFTNSVPPIRLYFDVAYAPFDNVYYDSLIVEEYSDCPGNATRIYAKGNTVLATSPATNSIFVPAPNQWRTDTINLNALAGSSPLYFRFVAKTGYGNQMYIDNINLSAGGLGVVPLDNNSFVHVYPNPASNNVNIDVSTSTDDPIVITVFDATGRVVRKTEQENAGGSNRISMDVSQLREGIYLVKTQCGALVKTQRISVVR
ncbi:MAG TPA: T9SS type A sorting domain-containing protein, partial [Bacteroidia bacterium]